MSVCYFVLYKFLFYSLPSTMYGRNSLSTSKLQLDRKSKLEPPATRHLSLLERCRRVLKKKGKSVENAVAKVPETVPEGKPLKETTKASNKSANEATKPAKLVDSCKSKVYFSKNDVEAVSVTANTPTAFKPKMKTYSTYSVKPKTMITCRTRSTSSSFTPKTSTPKKSNSQRKTPSSVPLRAAKSLNDVQTRDKNRTEAGNQLKDSQSTASRSNPGVLNKLLTSKTFFVDRPLCDRKREPVATSEYCSQTSLTSIKEDSSTQYDLNDIAAPRNVPYNLQDSTLRKTDDEPSIVMMSKRDLADAFRGMLDRHVDELTKRRRLMGDRGRKCCCRRKWKRYDRTKEAATQTDAYIRLVPEVRQIQTTRRPMVMLKDGKPIGPNWLNVSISSRDSIRSHYEYPTSLSITFNFDEELTWEDEFVLVGDYKKSSSTMDLNDQYVDDDDASANEADVSLNDDDLVNDRERSANRDDEQFLEDVSESDGDDGGERPSRGNRQESNDLGTNYREELLNTTGESKDSSSSLIDNVNQLENYYEKSNSFYRKRIGTYIDSLETIRKDMIDMEKRFTNMKIKFD